MLRIGKLTDYAMLILSQMAKDPDLVLSATSLAESLRLSAPTVSKILKMLSDADLVTSLRGADGGYRLARAVNTITLAEVIAAMEGHLALTECCESAELCAINTMCTLKENWAKVNGMVHAFLARITISDMMGTLSLQGVTNG